MADTEHDIKRSREDEIADYVDTMLDDMLNESLYWKIGTGEPAPTWFEMRDAIMAKVFAVEHEMGRQDLDPTRAAEVHAEHGPQGTCEKYEEPTAEDIAADDAAMEAAIARMKRTLPLCARIKAEHKGESWKGVETCPECGGKLHLSHAAMNGHVWGKCETENCLAWME